MADNLILSRSFIPSTVHMVLFLQLAKLHQKKTDRDYFYLIILAFMMVLAAASMTIDVSFIATLMFFLISLVATLMSFEIVTIPGLESLETNRRWFPDWTHRVGIVMDHRCRRRTLLRHSTRGHGLLQPWQQVRLVLLSGFSDNVRLGEIGEIKLSSAIVMRAKRVSGKPSSGMKWRGIALDRFDGRSWHKSDITHERHPIRMKTECFSVRPHGTPE